MEKTKERTNQNKQICEKCCKEKSFKDFSKSKKIYKKKICFSCYSTFLTEQKNHNCGQTNGNINYRLKKSLASHLRKVLTKNDTTMNYIGCNIQYLREWLEYNFTEEMNWENYGTYWLIEHVVPISKFDLINENEKFKCWNWSNLMPYPNGVRGTKFPDIHDIIEKINKFKEEGSTTKWFSGDILTLEFAKSKLDMSS
jgi:hypothetical protein